MSGRDIEQIKILYLVTMAEMGGAQRYILDLVENLPPGEFSAAVAAGGTGPLLDTLRENGVPVHALSHLRRDIAPAHDLAAIREVANLLRLVQPDILHLNSSKAGVIGALAARQARIPAVLYTAHGFVFNEPIAGWQKMLYRGLERWSARYKSAIICVSEADRQSALRYHIAPAEKLVTIHNGINPEKIQFLPHVEAREQIKKLCQLPTANCQLVGAVANLYPTKGLADLIAAAGIVIKKIPDAHFVVLGEGPERARLEKIILQNHLETRMHLIGAVPQAARLLPAFDLIVNASRKEGLPYAVLEALASGRPVVATAVGGVPEIIRHEREGLLVSANDPPALATAIQSLLSDPQRAKHLGQAGIARIHHHFTLARMVEQTVACYRKFLSPYG